MKLDVRYRHWYPYLSGGAIAFMLVCGPGMPMSMVVVGVLSAVLFVPLAVWWCSKPIKSKKTPDWKSLVKFCYKQCFFYEANWDSFSRHLERHPKYVFAESMIDRIIEMKTDPHCTAATEYFPSQVLQLDQVYYKFGGRHKLKDFTALNGRLYRADYHQFPVPYIPLEHTADFLSQAFCDWKMLEGPKTRDEFLAFVKKKGLVNHSLFTKPFYQQNARLLQMSDDKIANLIDQNAFLDSLDDPPLLPSSTLLPSATTPTSRRFNAISPSATTPTSTSFNRRSSSIPFLGHDQTMSEDSEDSALSPNRVPDGVDEAAFYKMKSHFLQKQVKSAIKDKKRADDDRSTLANAFATQAKTDENRVASEAKDKEHRAKIENRLVGCLETEQGKNTKLQDQLAQATPSKKKAPSSGFDHLLNKAVKLDETHKKYPNKVGTIVGLPKSKNGFFKVEVDGLQISISRGKFHVLDGNGNVVDEEL